jgi:DNA-binding GntR family transcriptional regulator
LRERITRHELPPGSKLFENELSSEFGVSRAKIRDVLAILQQRGLIKRIPKRGAVVERLDPAQVFHIYNVREALEGVCARLATQNMPPESWQDLVTLFGKPIEDDIKRGDLEAYIAKLDIFRRRTIEGAQNPVLADMLENIQDRTRMIIRRIIILPGRAEIGLREHRAVLQAMRKGDAEAAETAKRANIRSGIEYLRRYQSFVL